MADKSMQYLMEIRPKQPTDGNSRGTVYDAMAVVLDGHPCSFHYMGGCCWLYYPESELDAKTRRQLKEIPGIEVRKL